ncbi:MAG: rhomboid family intramembrane serine protease [Treponema sp.]|nr:rhomboid family intramembrane serine protease [Treponema sp.]MCL2237074.1 rhomboid family intramembrane serine protease [Treponema sp.]
MRIKYNAPTVLTFTLFCAAILLLSKSIFPGLIETWFMVPGKDHFNPKSINHWVTLITHVCGHANWTHLISNFTLILLIGPMLEESYGSKSLFIMTLITALVTGVLNVLLFKSFLLGASGVVFMMILLSSFTNFSKGEIPLTFILVLILYMGVQLFNSLNDDNISQFAHIIGGLCGSFFGFFRSPKIIKR